MYFSSKTFVHYSCLQKVKYAKQIDQYIHEYNITHIFSWLWGIGGGEGEKLYFHPEHKYITLGKNILIMQLNRIFENLNSTHST